MKARILVWDWPVRLGHWLMAGGFALAWLTAEAERWRQVHVLAGSCVLAVAAFRIVWGLIGSRHARFSDFLRGPAAVLGYLRSLLGPEPLHTVGHNPAGGWAIVLLLSLGLLTGASGWANFNELGGHWLEEAHEALASAMLTVVVVHLAGVASACWLHRENLVRAMLDGRKLGAPEAALKSARPLVGVLLLAWVVLVSRWLTA